MTTWLLQSDDGVYIVDPDHHWLARPDGTLRGFASFSPVPDSADNPAGPFIVTVTYRFEGYGQGFEYITPTHVGPIRPQPSLARRDASRALLNDQDQRPIGWEVRNRSESYDIYATRDVAERVASARQADADVPQHGWPPIDLELEIDPIYVWQEHELDKNLERVWDE